MHKIDIYDEAVEYKRKQRRMTPPLYNAGRLMERPFPNVSQPLMPFAEVSVDGIIEPNTIHPDENSSIDSAVDDSLEQNVTNMENADMDLDDGSFLENPIGGWAIEPNALHPDENASIGNAVVESLGQNVVNEPHSAMGMGYDPFADNAVGGSAEIPATGPNDNTYNSRWLRLSSSIASMGLSMPLLNSSARDPLEIKPEEDEEVYNSDIAVEDIDRMHGFHVTKFGDGLEMYFENAESFVPMLEVFRVKCNDPFCGNIPFKVDVSHLHFTTMRTLFRRTTMIIIFHPNRKTTIVNIAAMENSSEFRRRTSYN